MSEETKSYGNRRSIKDSQGAIKDKTKNLKLFVKHTKKGPKLFLSFLKNCTPTKSQPQQEAKPMT